MADAPFRELRAGGALVLALDRPGSGNALDEGTVAALRAPRRGGGRRRPALRHSDRHGTLLLRRRLPQAYRALADRAALERVFGAARDLLDAIETRPLPVVAAIAGHALGGGAELALACDLRVAGTGARTGFPQFRLGIVPGWDGLERLARLVGLGTAMRLVLTGERLDGEGARAAKLVEISTPDALPAAKEVAAALDRAAPFAVRGAKAAMRALRLPPREARREAADIFARLRFTDDHREAEAAFAEKRRPVFHGR